MIKDTDIITVIDSNVLFDNEYKKFQGFVPSDSSHLDYKADFESIILNNSRPMMHGLADKDPDLKQILACVFIINTKGLISAYKTAMSGKDSITAPNGTWSCGYRGHVMSLVEAIENPFITDPIFYTRSQNLKNEIALRDGSLDIKNATLLGYTNNDFNDSNTILKTHFTLIYALRTDASDVVKLDALCGKMLTPEELENKIKLSNIPASGTSVDLWTNQSFESIRRYIGFFQANSLRK